MREPCEKLGLSKARWGEVGRGIYHMVRVILWHVWGLCVRHWHLGPRAAVHPGPRLYSITRTTLVLHRSASAFEFTT